MIHCGYGHMNPLDYLQRIKYSNYDRQWKSMVITMNIMAICHNMGTPKYAFLGKKGWTCLAYHLSWFCYHYCCLWKMEVIPTLILINQQSEKDMIWIFHWGTLQDRNAHGAYFQVWSAFMFFFQSSLVSIWVCLKIGYPPNFMEFMSHIFPIYFPLKWPLDGAFPMAFPWRPRTPRCWGQGEGRPGALHLHDLDQRDVVIPDLRR